MVMNVSVIETGESSGKRKWGAAVQGGVCRKKVGRRKDSKTRGKSEVYILRCLTMKQTLEISESLERDLALLGMGE